MLVGSSVSLWEVKRLKENISGIARRRAEATWDLKERERATSTTKDFISRREVVDQEEYPGRRSHRREQEEQQHQPKTAVKTRREEEKESPLEFGLHLFFLLHRILEDLSFLSTSSLSFAVLAPLQKNTKLHFVRKKTQCEAEKRGTNLSLCLREETVQSLTYGWWIAFPVSSSSSSSISCLLDSCVKRRGWRRWEWNKKQKHKRCHQLHPPSSSSS